MSHIYSIIALSFTFLVIGQAKAGDNKEDLANRPFPAFQTALSSTEMAGGSVDALRGLRKVFEHDSNVNGFLKLAEKQKQAADVLEKTSSKNVDKYYEARARLAQATKDLNAFLRDMKSPTIEAFTEIKKVEKGLSSFAVSQSTIDAVKSELKSGIKLAKFILVGDLVFVIDGTYRFHLLNNNKNPGLFPAGAKAMSLIVPSMDPERTVEEPSAERH